MTMNFLCNSSIHMLDVSSDALTILPVNGRLHVTLQVLPARVDVLPCLQWLLL